MSHIEIDHNKPLDYANHPLLTDNAIVQTRQLEDFVNVIDQWLDTLIPGGIVYGEQRIGKTAAVNFFMAHGPALLGINIPLAMISAWEPSTSSSTENRFFGELLRVMRYPLPASRTAAVKRSRVIDLITEQTRDNKEHRFLLFVDEAQWLARSQYRYLMDLHNQLKVNGVRLITILVGQPELRIIRNDLRGGKQGHLLGRFMAAEYAFEGITGFHDWERMLMAIDRDTEYPKGSGCSYTRYFLPDAFDAGWRLHRHARLIWDTLESLCRKQKIPEAQQLPMQPLTALVRYLLQRLSKEPHLADEMPINLVEEVILRVAILQIEDHAVQYPAQKSKAA